MAKDSFLNSVFISHAWGGISDEVTDALTAKFREKDISYVLDKNHLGYRGSIQDFMIQLGKADMVVIILSNKYLRSEFCMFELIQIYKNDRLRDRIYPIVLDEVSISKSTDRIELVKYWEDQIEQLQSKLKELNSLSYIEGFTEDLNLYTEIRNNIAKLTSILRDINSLNLRMHSEGDFEILCNGILEKMGRKIPKPQPKHQPKSESISPNAESKSILKKEISDSDARLLDSIHTSKVWIKWAGLAFIAVFLILGLGKYMFGNNADDQNAEIQSINENSMAGADSLRMIIDAYLKAGAVYFPDKDCAWRSFKQLESRYPAYPYLDVVKRDLLAGLIEQINKYLTLKEPFEAQLVAPKIKELDPDNIQLTTIEKRINDQKAEVSELPQTDIKINQQAQTSNNPPAVIKNTTTESNPVNQNTNQPSKEIITESKPAPPVVEEKKEHKTRTVSIPVNTEIVLVANEEFSSDESISTYKKYYFKVAKPVYINGIAAITTDDKAEVKFTKVKKSDFKRSGSLEFEITRLILSNGSPISLKSGSFFLKSESDTPLIIAPGQKFKVKTAQNSNIEK